MSRTPTLTELNLDADAPTHGCRAQVTRTPFRGCAFAAIAVSGWGDEDARCLKRVAAFSTMRDVSSAGTDFAVGRGNGRRTLPPIRP